MRKVKGILGVIAGLMLMFNAASVIAYADDHGNNGTIKIVSTTDPASDNDNDPKVCSFHIAGMNFDNSSSGTWSISGQGGGAGSGTASGTWTANASGAWQTADMTLPAGQYKASAKQTAPATSGGDKQKVFKVTCEQGTTGGNNGGNNAATPTPAPTQNGNGNGSTGETGSTGSTGSTGGNGSTGGTGSTGETGSTGAIGASGASGAQGNLNVPGSAVQGNVSTTGNGVQGNISIPGSSASGVSPNLSSLPSTSTDQKTSTDQNGPLAMLGMMLVTLGAFLLRRTGQQPQ